jgi:tRNA pseudouridine65 synthase
MLEIVFEDAHYIAINKPNGLLVHRSKLAAYEKEFAMQKLRDQIGQHVFPVHRLDRATSGLLLFAKDAEAAKRMSQLFIEQQIEKQYWTVVRGYTEESGEIDAPILDENKQEAQQALTFYQRLATVELPIPISRYPAARYSLVEVYPKTGRRHQIRRHFAKIRHYIVGDKRHGDCKHNKLFKEHFESETMLLHARSLRFVHPYTQENIEIEAPLRGDFERFMEVLQWQYVEIASS